MIVVKVGTSTLTDKSGSLDTKSVRDIAKQVVQLVKESKRKVIIVSSGAVAAGTEYLALEEKPARITELQAAASVGQGLLINVWADALSFYGLKIGQVLLSQQDFIHREQYLNARNTLNKLHEYGVIPLINENDATSVEELRLGDNDILAAMVSTLVNATDLVLVTDTDYLYEERDGERRALKTVKELTPRILALGKGKGSHFASGGMMTKLQAAQIAVNFGVRCSIVNGRKKKSIVDILNGKDAGTVFLPREKVVKGKRAWIAFGRPPKGDIIIDNGAREAILNKGRSLLAAGIKSISGNFQVGDTVNLADEHGVVIAKGLTNYSSLELAKIKGLKTSDISGLFGEDFVEEAIHRDHLVLLV